MDPLYTPLFYGWQDVCVSESYNTPTTRGGGIIFPIEQEKLF